MQLIGLVQLVAGGEADLPRVLALLEENGIETKGNPDLTIEMTRLFGIDDARSLAAKASLRALGGQRVFVISAGSITIEAQNALLKTLEDAQALFLFVTPAPQLLLPTLRSRAQILFLEAKPLKESLKRGDEFDPKEFLSAPVKERIDLLKPLLEKEDGETRDLAKILSFLDSLEGTLALESPKNWRAIEAVYRAKEYMRDKGALLKPLLEQVALSV